MIHEGGVGLCRVTDGGTGTSVVEDLLALGVNNNSCGGLLRAGEDFKRARTDFGYRD